MQVSGWAEVVRWTRGILVELNAVSLVSIAADITQISFDVPVSPTTVDGSSLSFSQFALQPPQNSSECPATAASKSATAADLGAISEAPDATNATADATNATTTTATDVTKNAAATTNATAVTDTTEATATDTTPHQSTSSSQPAFPRSMSAVSVVSSTRLSRMHATPDSVVYNKKVMHVRTFDPALYAKHWDICLATCSPSPAIIVPTLLGCCAHVKVLAFTAGPKHRFALTPLLPLSDPLLGYGGCGAAAGGGGCVATAGGGGGGAGGEDIFGAERESPLDHVCLLRQVCLIGLTLACVGIDFTDVPVLGVVVDGGRVKVHNLVPRPAHTIALMPYLLELLQQWRNACHEGEGGVGGASAVALLEWIPKVEAAIARAVAQQMPIPTAVQHILIALPQHLCALCDAHDAAVVAMPELGF